MDELSNPSTLEPGSFEPAAAPDDSAISIAVLMLGALLVIPGFLGLVF